MSGQETEETVHSIYLTDIAPLTHGTDGSDRSFEISVNAAIKLKGLSLSKDKKLITPAFVSKSGKSEPQYDFLDDKVKNEIIRAITAERLTETGKKDNKMKFSITTFKKIKYKQKGTGSAKSMYKGKVLFNDTLEVSVTIFEGDEPRISWASIKSKKGEYSDMVVFLNQKLKDIVEASLVEKYEVSKKRVSGKRKKK